MPRGTCAGCGKPIVKRNDPGTTAADGKPRCTDCYEIWRELHIVQGFPLADGSVFDEEEGEWY